MPPAGHRERDHNGSDIITLQSVNMLCGVITDIPFYYNFTIK